MTVWYAGWNETFIRPKYVENINKLTKKNCAPIWLYLQDYTGMDGQQNKKRPYQIGENSKLSKEWTCNKYWGFGMHTNVFNACFKVILQTNILGEKNSLWRQLRLYFHYFVQWHIDCPVYESGNESRVATFYLPRNPQKLNKCTFITKYVTCFSLQFLLYFPINTQWGTLDTHSGTSCRPSIKAVVYIFQSKLRLKVLKISVILSNFMKIFPGVISSYCICTDWHTNRSADDLYRRPAGMYRRLER